jgi:hypothetical protein
MTLRSGGALTLYNTLINSLHTPGHAANAFAASTFTRNPFTPGQTLDLN